MSFSFLVIKKSDYIADINPELGKRVEQKADRRKHAPNKTVWQENEQ
jgi:hypothetical protein